MYLPVGRWFMETWDENTNMASPLLVELELKGCRQSEFKSWPVEGSARWVTKEQKPQVKHRNLVRRQKGVNGAREKQRYYEMRERKTVQPWDSDWLVPQPPGFLTAVQPTGIYASLLLSVQGKERFCLQLREGLKKDCYVFDSHGAKFSSLISKFLCNNSPFKFHWPKKIRFIDNKH